MDLFRCRRARSLRVKNKRFSSPRKRSRSPHTRARVTRVHFGAPFRKRPYRNDRYRASYNFRDIFPFRRKRLLSVGATSRNVRRPSRRRYPVETRRRERFGRAVGTVGERVYVRYYITDVVFYSRGFENISNISKFSAITVRVQPFYRRVNAAYHERRTRAIVFTTRAIKQRIVPPILPNTREHDTTRAYSKYLRVSVFIRKHAIVRNGG